MMLLMNPGDIDYDELNVKGFALLNPKERPGILDSASEFIMVCQRILKREWEVVKSELEKAKRF